MNRSLTFAALFPPPPRPEARKLCGADSRGAGRRALRVGLLALAAAWTALAIAAPLWKSPWLYLLFDAVCHQRPERSLWLAGAPMAVCARCLGVYAGAVIGLAAFLPARRNLFLGALVLMGADLASEALGLRPASTAIRCLTGAAAGALAAPLVMQVKSDEHEAISDQPSAISRLTAAKCYLLIAGGFSSLVTRHSSLRKLP